MRIFRNFNIENKIKTYRNHYYTILNQNQLDNWHHDGPKT